MTTKELTALIWNEVEQLRYAVVEGDLRKFQGIYLNSMGCDETKHRELNSVVYDEEGRYRIQFCDLQTLQDAVVHGAWLVEAGFLEV